MNHLETEAVIEIPRGSRNKYEYDHKRHILRLDRVLYSAVQYPTDYGFIPDTLEPDGDPIDVLVLTYEPTFPGCHVDIRIIGVLAMSDDKGEDNKLLAVPMGEPRLNRLTTIEDLDPHWLREVENFFGTYKLLEDKSVDLRGWLGPDEAESILCAARERFVGSH